METVQPPETAILPSRRSRIRPCERLTFLAGTNTICVARPAPWTHHNTYAAKARSWFSRASLGVMNPSFSRRHSVL